MSSHVITRPITARKRVNATCILEQSAMLFGVNRSQGKGYTRDGRHSYRPLRQASVHALTVTPWSPVRVLVRHVPRRRRRKGLVVDALGEEGDAARARVILDRLAQRTLRPDHH